MSTTIDQSFVRQYERDVWQVFQRYGGFLRNSVRTKDGVVGTSTTFQKVGKGTATTKARHGQIPPMNQDHTPITCTLEDFYAGDYVDKLDEAKVNIDERMVIAQGGAWALGRKVDDQIIAQLNATTQSTVSWTVTSIGAVRASLLQMIEALDANDVPNDGGRYAALTPRAWSQAMTVPQFNSSDWVGPSGQEFTKGNALANTPSRWKEWMGVKWISHTALPGRGTSSASVYVWHKNALGYATGAFPGNVAMNAGQQVGADIWWNGERAAHFVNHAMSGGAALIDDTGVIEGSLNDTTAIATS